MPVFLLYIDVIEYNNSVILSERECNNLGVRGSSTETTSEEMFSLFPANYAIMIIIAIIMFIIVRFGYKRWQYNGIERKSVVLNKEKLNII